MDTDKAKADEGARWLNGLRAVAIALTRASHLTHSSISKYEAAGLLEDFPITTDQLRSALRCADGGNTNAS